VAILLHQLLDHVVGFIIDRDLHKKLQKVVDKLAAIYESVELLISALGAVLRESLVDQL